MRSDAKLRQKNIMQVPLGALGKARPYRAQGPHRQRPRGSPADYQVAFFECNLA